MKKQTHRGPLSSSSASPLRAALSTPTHPLSPPSPGWPWLARTTRAWGCGGMRRVCESRGGKRRRSCRRRAQMRGVPLPLCAPALALRALTHRPPTAGVRPRARSAWSRASSMPTGGPAGGEAGVVMGTGGKQKKVTGGSGPFVVCAACLTLSIRSPQRARPALPPAHHTSHPFPPATMREIVRYRRSHQLARARGRSRAARRGLCPKQRRARNRASPFSFWFRRRRPPPQATMLRVPAARPPARAPSLPHP